MKPDDFWTAEAIANPEPIIDESRFERLFLDNEEFDKLAEAMDVFCPFDAVGMDNQEIRHGYFLSYILSPQRPHGFGSECLRGFMWAAAAALKDDTSTRLRPLDVHLMNLDSAIIEREYSANVGGKQRMIDILIKIPAEKVVITVELKIDAVEHSGQLKDYRQFVSKEFPVSTGWKQLFLFVTKRDDKPSSGDGEGWQELSLRTIAAMLERTVLRGSGHADARMMVSAYVAMLRRKHLTDPRLENLAKALWLEHEEVLDYLMKQRPNVAAKIFDVLRKNHKSIAKRFSDEASLEIETERSTNSIIRFAIKSWDNAYGLLSGTSWNHSERLILFEVSRTKGEIKFEFVIGLGEKDAREKLIEVLQIQKLFPEKFKMKDFLPLGTTILYSSQDLLSKDLQIETICEDIVSRVAEYLRDHAFKYTEAIKTLPQN